MIRQCRTWTEDATVRATRLRLLADLPLEIEARGITHRFEIVPVPVSGLWQLRASYPGGYWLCAYAADEDKVRRAVYRDGPKPAARLVRAVFERLVMEGTGGLGVGQTCETAAFIAPPGSPRRGFCWAVCIQFSIHKMNGARQNPGLSLAHGRPRNMPIKFSIDGQRGVVFATASGVIRFADAVDHMDRLLHHPQFRPEFKELYDFRPITELAMSSGEVRKLAARTVFAADSQRAFLVSSDFGFGIGRMFSSYREIGGERGIQVFKAEDEARAWLHLSDSG